MNFSEQFPFQVYISHGERQDRRRALESQLRHHSMENAQWFSAVDCDIFKNDTRGFLNLPKRSLALGNRLLLRKAGKLGFPNLFFFEDDAVFHPEFSERISALELPDDWGIFYLGCQHMERPHFVAPGLVRVRQALDTHAFAVRNRYFMDVRSAMRGLGKGSKGKLHSDVLLATLHEKIPTYAAMPNLCWQLECYSDLVRRRYSNYCQKTGRQKNKRETVSDLEVGII